MDQTKKFFTGKVIVNLLSLVVILVTIPVGVYLTLHPQTLKSSAATPEETKLELIGPNITTTDSTFQASSRQIGLRLTYIPVASSSAFPTNFRVANSLESLPYAKAQLFSQNNQEISWFLTSGSGQKNIFAQFETAGSWLKPISQTVTLSVSPSPVAFKLGSNMADINLNATDLDKALATLASSRVGVVRVFVGNDQLSDDQTASGLDAFLTQAEQHQLQVIPVLIDDYGTKYHPLSTTSYYSSSSLDYTFFGLGYETGYLDFVRTVVTLNAPHPNIYAWEIGNELKNNTNMSNLINFFQTASAVVKGLDPVHDVALGVASSADSGLLPLQLYTNLSNIDLVTIHLKANQSKPIADLNWAKQHFRSVIVEDSQLGDPVKDKTLADKIKAEQLFWQNQGVVAFFGNSINNE